MIGICPPHSVWGSGAERVRGVRIPHQCGLYGPIRLQPAFTLSTLLPSLACASALGIEGEESLGDWDIYGNIWWPDLIRSFSGQFET
jgi:hypothetical protein